MTTAYKLRTLMAVILILVLAAVPLKAQSLPQVELVGVVESMTLDAIVVNGLDIDIQAAELNTAITVDEVVKVEGFLLLDGSILASEINAVDEDVQLDEVELIGTLDSFAGSTMVINGQMVDVSGAEVKQGVTVGQMVKVHARATVTNTWVAREVEAYTSDDSVTNDSSDPSQPQPGEFEFTGTLEQIGQGFIVVSGQNISTEGAEIKNQLIVGVRVRLHVRIQNGMMFAREIEFAFGRDDDNTNTNSNANTNMNANVNSNTNTNTNANTNFNDNSNSNDNTSVDTAISADQAVAIVLGIYPNTTITEIELKTMFGGTLVWDIETSHDIEIVIDAQTGVILAIDMHNGGNSNNNNNSNANANFNSNDNNDDDDHNGNANFNSNDNDDDDGDDNNSGSRSDDDDDDNSGRRSDDDDDD